MSYGGYQQGGYGGGRGGYNGGGGGGGYGGGGDRVRLKFSPAPLLVLC